MEKNIRNEDWLWVVIQDPEAEAQIVGQQDEKQGVAFIPVFSRKEEAFQCLNLLAKQPGKKYEPQAIIYEDLARYASSNGLLIFILDGEGRVLDKIRV
ncbi:MAG: hypothetical protein ACOZF0_20510 [Thermodesulfobacteriota bacterium]